MISAIIVAYNEEVLVEAIIKELKQQRFQGKYEIILADGGSQDNTIPLAKELDVRIVACPKGKAKQMNEAAKHAKGDILFFVHADMTFSDKTFSVIQQKIDEGYDGGGFSNEFDTNNKKIKQLGTWMNFRFFDRREQSDKGVFYGDNGIFVKKDVFEAVDGFKPIPIMEDYDFSVRMKKNNFQLIKIKDPKIIVSARRHIKAGFFKTRFQWVMIRKLYNCGVSPERLAKWYSDIR